MGAGAESGWGWLPQVRKGLLEETPEEETQLMRKR